MLFDKRKTDVVKGVAIIMMLIHHLFAPDMLAEFTVITRFVSIQTLSWISNQLKICVSIFVFLSAFGITKQIRKSGLENRMLFSSASVRFVKLLLDFLFVYLCGLCICLIKGNIFDAYKIDNGYILIVYILIDAFGLATLFDTPTINATWWYMSVAYLVIFCVPIINILYKKFGKLLLAVFCFVGVPTIPHVGVYFLVVILGVCVAQEDWLEKLYKKFWTEKCIPCRVVMMIIMPFFLLGILWIRRITGLTYWLDAVLALIICLWGMMLSSCVPKIAYVLGYLGKHSMNIFLCHTFIYFYFFKEFIYSFKHAMIILMVLLLLTLILSVLLELIKNKSGYYKLVQNITKNIFLEKRESYDKI